VVPSEYETTKRTRFKARALQYLLEQRTARLQILQCPGLESGALGRFVLRRHHAEVEFSFRLFERLTGCTSISVTVSIA